MWIEIYGYKNGVFYGTLANDPRLVENVKFGDQVSIKKEDIEDWMIEDYYQNGYYGGYTFRVLEGR